MREGGAASSPAKIRHGRTSNVSAKPGFAGHGRAHRSTIPVVLPVQAARGGAGGPGRASSTVVGTSPSRGSDRSRGLALLRYVPWLHPPIGTATEEVARWKGFLSRITAKRKTPAVGELTAGAYGWYSHRYGQDGGQATVGSRSCQVGCHPTRIAAPKARPHRAQLHPLAWGVRHTPKWWGFQAGVSPQGTSAHRSDRSIRETSASGPKLHHAARLQYHPADRESLLAYSPPPLRRRQTPFDKAPPASSWVELTPSVRAEVHAEKWFSPGRFQGSSRLARAFEPLPSCPQHPA